jgi:hypothetical protein
VNRLAGLLAVDGAIAQLVEHLHGMQGVSGSNPLGSTSKIKPVTDRFFGGLQESLF